jgi:hypothetical protein
MAWAVRTRLDVANERSVLAVISTLALCAVFDDDAAVLTAAAPTPLWARRLPRGAVPVLVLGAAWAVTVTTVAVRRAGPAEFTPWWAMTLEWSTVAASQLAVGAVAARRPAAKGSIAPGLLVAVVWLGAEGASMLHRHFHPVQAHAPLWGGLLLCALATITAASREPSWRRRSAVGKDALDPVPAASGEEAR